MRALIRFATGLTLCGLVLLSSAGAQSAPAQGPALNWIREAGAESCIGSVELAQLIETRLGRAVFVAAPVAVVAIEGKVRPAREGGFVAEIAVSDGAGVLYGSRTLQAARDCRQLDEALALVIAITLRPEGGAVGGIPLPPEVVRSLEALFGDEPADPDPDALPARPTTTSTQNEETTRGATPDATAPAVAPEPEAEPDRFSFSSDAGVWVASGLQPHGSFGPALALRVADTQLGSLRLRGALSLISTSSVIDGDGRGQTRFQVLAATLAYCSPALALDSLGPLGVALCAGAGLGNTEVEARGFEIHNAGGSRSWLALTLEAELRLTLVGRLSAVLALGAEARVPRAEFVYSSADTDTDVLLHRADSLGATALLGLSIRAF